MNFVPVARPITLETISHKLHLNMYSNIEEFKEDMNTIIDNSRIYCKDIPNF